MIKNTHRNVRKRDNLNARRTSNDCYNVSVLGTVVRYRLILRLMGLYVPTYTVACVCDWVTCIVCRYTFEGWQEFRMLTPTRRHTVATDFSIFIPYKNNVVGRLIRACPYNCVLPLRRGFFKLKTTDEFYIISSVFFLWRKLI